MSLNIKVGITDHLDPEVNAMLQAMYSRSYGPIAERIPSDPKDVEGHKEKLGKFYVNYGHRSVGQLGSTTIWLEGVSLLAAKAIENHPLYNGQESSTRYIDFGTQPMISTDPFITEWQQIFRHLYIQAIPVTVDKLKMEFPYEGDPSDNGAYTKWENTIKARAFDICRGILPAGITTNVAFTGTFDLINDHFGEMLYHPCQEMKEIANKVIDGLAEKYSYAAMPKEKLLKNFSNVNYDFFYIGKYSEYKSMSNGVDVSFGNYVDSITDDINGFSIVFPRFKDRDDFSLSENLRTRAKYQKIPNMKSKEILFKMSGLLDFGSWRDLHRHRNGFITTPILNLDHGVNEWYLENLPAPIARAFNNLVNELRVSCETSNLDPTELQYCIPIGVNVPVDYRCDFNQAMYIFELRSGKTVHQTLRKLVNHWVQETHAIFNTCGITDLVIHNDPSKDNFTLRRGEQTFNAELLGEFKFKLNESDRDTK
jgi:thymidylate synthase ThyX